MKEIKILHPFLVPAPRHQVWEFLWNVQAVAGCIPGCQAVIVKEANLRYEAEIERKVGMFLIGMKLDIQVLRLIPFESIAVEILGRDARLKSSVRQTLDIDLVDDGGDTRISIHATLIIEGMLAAISKYLIEMQVKRTLDDFAENFALELNKRIASRFHPNERYCLDE